MTGRDDKLPSVLVLAQDGRTAPLRTLFLTAVQLAFRWFHSVSTVRGGAVMPRGVTAKRPGWDGTAIRSPSRAAKVEDCRPWAGRWTLRSETC